MSADREPSIDGRAWGAYVEAGRGHFERVVRSRNVFVRNANELVGLLADAEFDIFKALALMEAGPADTVDDELRQSILKDAEAFRNEFWSALDQRLHNLCAAVVSLIDHTRPLIDFYQVEPEFQAEFRRRNQAVAENPRSRFVRRLRNFLVHVGVAPLSQTMSLGPSNPSDPHLEIRLASTGLLQWSGFEGDVRAYIEAHPEGLPLRQIVGEYVTEVVDLYQWLLEQYSTLHQTGHPPRHLREGRSSDVRSGP